MEEEEEDEDVEIVIGGVPNKTTTTGSSPVTPNAEERQAQNIDLNAIGTLNGQSILEVDLDGGAFEDRPWRKPGADITDYFNYGFSEVTWRQYCMKQKTMREEAGQQKKIGVFEMGAASSAAIPPVPMPPFPPGVRPPMMPFPHGMPPGMPPMMPPFMFRPPPLGTPLPGTQPSTGQTSIAPAGSGAASARPDASPTKKHYISEESDTDDYARRDHGGSSRRSTKSGTTRSHHERNRHDRDRSHSPPADRRRRDYRD